MVASNGKVEGKLQQANPPLNPPVPKRVALLGLGPSSTAYVRQVDHMGDLAEIYDEVWTCNSYSTIFTHHMLWHMDDFRVQEIRAKAGNQRVANMLKALKRSKVPIMTSYPHQDYPASIKFPLEAIIQKYGSIYFTSTPAYAAAYAGFIGVNELTCFGLDYTWPGIVGEEAGRACMEYWLGRIEQQGVRVRVCQQSSLLDARVNIGEYFPYGYDAVKITAEEIKPGKVELKFAAKPLPSATEIETRYFHKRPEVMKEVLEREGASVVQITAPPSEPGESRIGGG